jgi:hypothetical protein
MDTYWKVAFREAMARNRVTYADLARGLRMSVPGIKKVFQKKDIGLERFNRIASILRVDASELIRKNHRGGIGTKTFSREADAYLADHPRALRLYFCLAFERLELKEAMQAMKLERAEAYAILRKLDRFGLVEWLEQDAIRIERIAPFVWDRRLASIKRFVRDEATAMVAECVERRAGRETIAFRYVSVSPTGARDLSAKLVEVVDAAERRWPYRGRRESQREGLKALKVLFCLSE